MDTVKRFNKGFSLVELMVAMSLSLFIIAGLFYSVLGDMKAYESVRGTQGIVTKSRMTLQSLRLYIQQAGFRDVAALRNNFLFTAGASTAGWQWQYGQNLQGTTSSAVITDGKSGSDIIAVRFSGAIQSGIISCDGTNLINNNTNEITLYVNNANQLMCKDNADAALLLDDNVEFLELLYGTTANTTRYFTASNVSDWSTVNRIKIGLLLSQAVSGNTLTNSNDYTIFNQTISAANDTNFRKVVMETVLIENQGD
jgi:type IV pilus assembly protein PilW